MKKYLFTLMAAVLSAYAMAQAPAFPGAEGVARLTTTGGRGGEVIHVTNLNDSGTGSLRAALNKSGKRIIVFDVSGIIELQSQLKISNGNVTILGQTAPGDGICLKNYTFNISASNVIVRFIRCRMGDEKKTEDDAMNSYTHSNNFNNIIIDHCSLSWSTDECGSFYGINNFTLQWCVLSESLRNSVHDKGKHGYGGIWGGKNAAYHHNLLAHHDSRNARLDHDYVSTLKGPVDYINNVIYNWGGNSTYGGEGKNTTNTYKMYNMINNYYKPGPATSSNVKSRIVNPTTKCKNCTGESTGLVNLVPGHFYITGNYMYGSATVTNDNWQGVNPDDASKKSEIKSDTRFIPEGYEGQTLLTTHTAENAFDKVLAYAGASYKKDVIDQRIAKETKEGNYTYLGSNGSTGGLIDTQDDVKGWPSYISKEKLTDTDNDGMPDIWEQAVAGKDITAAGYDLDPNGWYTNIEVYANSLVEDMVKAQNADAESSVSEYYPSVAKVNGIPYFDANVTAEGEYEQDEPVEGITGSITWTQPYNSSKEPNDATISSEIKSQINTGISLGTNILSTGTGTYNSVQFSKFEAQVIQETSANDDNTVTLSITPQSGYKFKGNNVSFVACKIGTGNGNLQAAWKDAGGKKTIVAETSPNRNNAEGGYYSTYSNISIADASTATEGTCSLIFHLYKLGVESSSTKKEMGLANIVINGTLVDATGISTPVTLKVTGNDTIYNLKGQKVSNAYKGIVIKEGKKMIQK